MAEVNGSDSDAHMFAYYQERVKWVSLHIRSREERKGKTAVTYSETQECLFRARWAQSASGSRAGCHSKVAVSAGRVGARKAVSTQAIFDRAFAEGRRD